MTKVLTLTFAEGATEEVEIHVLNVGEVFPNFGGSRHPLVAGSDFASGRKDKKPTASIVVRTHGGAMGISDKEYGIDSPEFWAWMGRLIGDVPGIVATAEERK